MADRTRQDETEQLSASFMPKFQLEFADFCRLLLPDYIIHNIYLLITGHPALITRGINMCSSRYCYQFRSNFAVCRFIRSKTYAKFRHGAFVPRLRFSFYVYLATTWGCCLADFESFENYAVKGKLYFNLWMAHMVAWTEHGFKNEIKWKFKWNYRQPIN